MGPWLAGDSTLLRSRPPPARCRFRSPECSPFGKTLLFLSTNKTGMSPRLVDPPGIQGFVPEEAVHRSAFAKAAADRPPHFRSASIPGGARSEVGREARCARRGTVREGQRSRRGCSGTRMPGSEGMDPWRPAPRVLGCGGETKNGPAGPPRRAVELLRNVPVLTLRGTFLSQVFR
jgi:hypothetical protein